MEKILVNLKNPFMQQICFLLMMKLINHHVYQSSELTVAILLTRKCTCPIVQVHDPMPI